MDDISVGSISALAADTVTPRRAIIDTGVCLLRSARLVLILPDNPYDHLGPGCFLHTRSDPWFFPVSIIQNLVYTMCHVLPLDREYLHHHRRYSIRRANR